MANKTVKDMVISKLVYEGTIVGYRFNINFSEGGKSCYDVEVESLATDLAAFLMVSIPHKEELTIHGGLLVTDVERSSAVIVKDISSNQSQLSSLLKFVKGYLKRNPVGQQNKDVAFKSSFLDDSNVFVVNGLAIFLVNAEVGVFSTGFFPSKESATGVEVLHITRESGVNWSVSLLCSSVEVLTRVNKVLDGYLEQDGVLDTTPLPHKNALFGAEQRIYSIGQIEKLMKVFGCPLSVVDGLFTLSYTLGDDPRSQVRNHDWFTASGETHHDFPLHTLEFADLHSYEPFDSIIKRSDFPILPYDHYDLFREGHNIYMNTLKAWSRNKQLLIYNTGSKVHMYSFKDWYEHEEDRIDMWEGQLVEMR
jgi:hypothetical protein